MSFDPFAPQVKKKAATQPTVPQQDDKPVINSADVPPAQAEEHHPNPPQYSHSPQQNAPPPQQHFSPLHSPLQEQRPPALPEQYVPPAQLQSPQLGQASQPLFSSVTDNTQEDPPVTRLPSSSSVDKKLEHETGSPLGRRFKQVIKKVKNAIFTTAVIEPALVVTEDSAETRTAEIENDVQAYQSYGNFACNSTIFFHMMDRWLTKINDEFFSRNNQFQTKYNHMYQRGELDVDSLREVEDTGNSKLKFLESCTEWENAFISLQTQLEKSKPEERKHLVDEAIELCFHVLYTLKQLAHRDIKYRVDTSNLEVYLSELQARNAKTSYSIPAVGLEKAGKSSTLNAIFGDDLLPAALEQCTLVVTQVHSSSSTKFEVKVFFRSEEELSEFLDDPNLKLSEGDIQGIKKDCKSMCGKMESEVADNAAAIKRFVESHVKDRRKQYIVKHVDIAVPNLQIGGNSVTFIDTPGSDARIRAHEKITTEVLNHADACLYVKRGSQPTDNNAGSELSERLQSKERPVVAVNNNFIGNSAANSTNAQAAQQDPDFHSLPKAKVFVVLTHLDMRVASRISEAVRLCKQELLKKGFKEDHIIPADPRFALFAQRQGVLTNEEKNEFAEYKNSAAFQESHLGEGIDLLKQRLAKFIENELPLIRARDAKACVVEVKKLLENTKAQLSRDIPNPNSFQAQIDHQKEELVKKTWDIKLTTSQETANEWLFYQFLNKKQQLTEEWKELFGNLFSSIFSDSDAHAQQLKVQIAKSRAYLGKINLDPIEDNERLRLVKFHLASLHNACEQLASSLWQLLLQFAGVLSSSLGEGLDFGWRLQDCMDFPVCLHEVESQVMRVIYPLVYAALRWPIRHEQRKFAVEELHTAVPEIFYTQQSETGILRIPVGVQGVLDVAVELGFLPKPVGAVAGHVMKSIMGGNDDDR